MTNETTLGREAETEEDPMTLSEVINLLLAAYVDAGFSLDAASALTAATLQIIVEVE